jgi:hypothetical protein
VLHREAAAADDQNDAAHKSVASPKINPRAAVRLMRVLTNLELERNEKKLLIIETVLGRGARTHARLWGQSTARSGTPRTLVTVCSSAPRLPMASAARSSFKREREGLR